VFHLTNNIPVSVLSKILVDLSTHLLLLHDVCSLFSSMYLWSLFTSISITMFLNPTCIFLWDIQQKKFRVKYYRDWHVLVITNGAFMKVGHPSLLHTVRNLTPGCHLSPAHQQLRTCRS